MALPFHPTMRPPPDKAKARKVRLPFSSPLPKTASSSFLPPLAYVCSSLAICAVPSKLFDLYLHQDERELTHAPFHRNSLQMDLPPRPPPFQVHHDLPPPSRAIHHHDHVQLGRQPIYNAHAGRHEKHCLFVYA